MEALRLWWNTRPDYQWFMRYHRSHPFLKHSETLMSVYGLFYCALCIGLLASPDLLNGTAQRHVVLACAGLALAISVVSIRRKIETKNASIAFIVGSDGGMAAVLFCMTPSPFAILATDFHRYR
ncbi:hypothetical protein CH254_24155 [Rhodococcus sp. 06-412-2C]|uniref:hypothetical protein n=1 Tax=unclassified Rhodococcus (in: high G+C Gram-positive bacteria) TaxID=192944 RepID=UPI000B9A5E22|nr:MULTISPECIES: hypothetical protein [unclassified Rhodococcus (in: high G+C Gram-positive bacteria)]OZC83979.1 hypothetical protein CH254_24155 [Rhodococcus sp. 06-412-2C]OZC94166.1 hypothetical protein CH279_22240 [Rhodococcus sp. 06-412-2B]